MEPIAPASSPGGSRSLARVLLVLLICVMAALLLSVDWVYSAMQRLLSAAEPVIAGYPVLGALVFVLLSALSAILAFFSSALLVPVAVFAWGNALTVALLWIGWLIGGICMYWLGHGMRAPGAAGSARVGRFASYLPRVSKEVSFPLVLLWQLALPSEIPGYLCGYLRVPFGTYVGALALGELPYAVAAVWLGKSVVDRQVGWLVGLGVLFATVAFLLLRLLYRRLDRG
jgi:uncharacterized membrane protein YdjX (TVP38/TMEM64 family)